MTEFRCDCGKFKAAIRNFPKNSPGRCVCYCDDCQTYLHFLGRPELLDSNGGSEIVPVYPSEFEILQGREVLACMRLSPKGRFRWFTSCCKTPVGNNMPGFPWLGTLARGYSITDPDYLEKTAGPVKSRIHGRFAKGNPPAGASPKISFHDLGVILPFLLRGFFTGKAGNSPFFKKDGVTPVVEPRILTLEERNQIRQKIGFVQI